MEVGVFSQLKVQAVKAHPHLRAPACAFLFTAFRFKFSSCAVTLRVIIIFAERTQELHTIRYTSSRKDQSQCSTICREYKCICSAHVLTHILRVFSSKALRHGRRQFLLTDKAANSQLQRSASCTPLNMIRRFFFLLQLNIYVYQVNRAQRLLTETLSKAWSLLRPNLP